jgi:hypothetical protein
MLFYTQRLHFLLSVASLTTFQSTVGRRYFLEIFVTDETGGVLKEVAFVTHANAFPVNLNDLILKGHGTDFTDASE